MKNSKARLITTGAGILLLTPTLVKVSVVNTLTTSIILLLITALILNLFIKCKNNLKLDRYIRFSNDGFLCYLTIKSILAPDNLELLGRVMGDILVGSIVLISFNAIYFISRALYLKMHTKRAMGAIDRHDELHELAIFGGEKERVEYVKFCHKHKLNNQLKEIKSN